MTSSSVTRSVTLDAELDSKLRALAEKHHRSMDGEIRWAVMRYLALEADAAMRAKFDDLFRRMSAEQSG